MNHHIIMGGVQKNYVHSVQVYKINSSIFIVLIMFYNTLYIPSCTVYTGMLLLCMHEAQWTV